MYKLKSSCSCREEYFNFQKLRAFSTLLKFLSIFKTDDQGKSVMRINENVQAYSQITVKTVKCRKNKFEIVF